MRDPSSSSRLLAARHLRVASVVLMVSLLLTGLAWHLSNRSIEQRARERFESRIDLIESAIRDRLAGYQRLLSQTVAMLALEPPMSQAQWGRFIERLDLNEMYPAIRAFMLLAPTDPDDPIRAAPVREWTADPLAQAVITRAIDSGRPALSAPVRLDRLGGLDAVGWIGRDLPSTGLLIVAPANAGSVHRQADAAGRDTAITALVVVALNPHDLLNSVVGLPHADLTVSLHDEAAAGPHDQLFASGPSATGIVDQTVFNARRSIQVMGRTWQLSMAALPGFLSASEARQSLIVALAGIMVALLLFVSMGLLSRQREHARSSADRLFQAFQDGEERFRLVVNAAEQAMLMVDRAGRITLANAASAQLFGLSRGDMLELPIRALIPSLAWDDSMTAVGDERFSPAGEFQGEAVRLDAIGVRRTGPDFPAEVILTPMRFNHDRYVLVTVNDMTERRAFERERERQLADLKRSNEDLESFAHVASHDLRAPLRAIDNLASWVADDARESLSPESQRHLDLMRKRIARMERLLTDLLLYGRASRESHPVESVDLAELIDEVRDLVRPSDGFVFSVVGDRPMIRTCRAPLRQVLINLVGNAIKHRGSDQGRVEIRWRTRAEGVAFEVSDDGPGIAPQFRERVFEMYQTLQPRDSLESSGMGLALVRRIVERFGGSVAVVDSPVPGTTIRFLWPDEMPAQASDAVVTPQMALA